MITLGWVRLRRAAVVGSAALLCSGIAAVPAAAASPMQLWVAEQGDDSGSCTRAQPCATVQRAVGLAGTTPAVIHAEGWSDFYGPIDIAAGQHIRLAGAGSEGWGGGGTSLDAYGTNQVITDAGWLAVTGVEVEPALHGIDLTSGKLTLTDVTDDASVGMTVSGGTARLDDVVFHNEGDGAVALQMTAGRVLAQDVTSYEETVIDGGSLTAHRLYSSGEPDGVEVQTGTARIDQSNLFSGHTLDVSGTGTAVVSRSYLGQGDPAAEVDGAGATAELVADTITAGDGHTLVQSAGRLEVAASAIVDPDVNGATACAGTITDGGYNQANDDSCGFDTSTSVNGSTRLVFHQPASDGVNRFDDLAPLARSSVVDAIPRGATAAFNPTVQLCAPGTTDLRGQPRPVDGACDVGSVELAPVRMTATVSPQQVPVGGTVSIRIHVMRRSTAPDLEPLRGRVVYTGMPSQCVHQPLGPRGYAVCTFNAQYAGDYAGHVRFEPFNAYHGRAKPLYLKVT